MQDLVSYIVLCGIFLFTLVLGLWAGKNVKTMKDYVLANRELSTAVVTMSFIATFFSGSDLLNPYGVFREGIIQMIFPLAYIISFTTIGIFVAPKMVYFNDCNTLGDIMRKLYGKEAGMLAGIAGLVLSMLIFSAQTQVILYINHDLLKLPSWCILGIILFIIFYTTLGGIRSVVYTDVLQLIIGIVTLLGFLNVLLYEIGGIKSLFNQLPAEKLSQYGSKVVWARVRSGAFWAVFPTFALTPPILQRMLMLARKDYVKNMFFAASIINFVIGTLLILIGLAVVVYCQGNMPLTQKVLQAKSIMSYMGTVIFESKYLQLFLFTGMLFVIFSTMDSFLQTAGVAFIHDFVKPWFNRKKIDIDEVRWVRGAIFVIGVISALSSLAYINLTNFKIFENLSWLSTSVSYQHAVIVYGMIIVPLLAGIMGLKTDKISFWLFVIAFITTMGIGTYFTKLHRYTVFLVSIGVASFIFFISHCILHKGFATVNRTTYATGYSLRKPSWRSFSKALAAWVCTPARLAKIAQRKVVAYGSEPFLFSLFFIGIPPFVLLSILQSLSALYISVVAYSIGITLVVGLMLEVKWFSWLKSYFDLYWFFTLGYCLPFFWALIFLINPQSTSAMIGFCLSLLVLIICVDWQTFVTLSSLGMPSALIAYRVLSGRFCPFMDFNMVYSLLTTLSAVLITGFFFARRKELYNFTQLTKAKLYAGSIAHETNNYLGTSLFAGQRINQALHSGQIKFSKSENTYSIPAALYEDLSFLGPELEQGAGQSLSKIKMFMSALKEDILNAKRELTSIKACIEEALKDVYFENEEVSKGLLLAIDDDFEAQVAKPYFKHIIYNIVRNAYYHGGATSVKIALEKAEQKLVIRDNGKGICAEKLPYIFDLFYSGGGSSGIGLALVKLIVESFGGTVHVESKQGVKSFTEFSVIFG